MKKRVLILVNHEIVIYNFRLEIVEKLLSEGYEVIISSPKGEKINKLIKLGCKFEEIKLNRHSKNPLEGLKLVHTYKLLIEKWTPAAILSFTIKPNIYGAIAAKASKTPFIANITGLGTAVEEPGLLQKITLCLYKFAFKDIKTIFFQNEENKSFFVKHNLFPNKHKLLPGSGVNLERFSYLEYPETKTIDFIFISRIMKSKGIDYYLEAARQTRKKFPNTRFHICGFCEENYEEILKVEEERGNIIYHGMVDDIQSLLKNMNCTIHPTYYPEGLSNVLLESAASGRPIITTNRSGCREVVNEFENKNGYLVEVKNQIELNRAIREFLNLTNTQMSEMGRNSRKKVEKEFDRNIVIQKYLEEIDETIIK